MFTVICIFIGENILERRRLKCFVYLKSAFLLEQNEKKQTTTAPAPAPTPPPPPQLSTLHCKMYSTK